MNVKKQNRHNRKRRPRPAQGNSQGQGNKLSSSAGNEQQSGGSTAPNQNRHKSHKRRRHPNRNRDRDRDQRPQGNQQPAAAQSNNSGNSQQRSPQGAGQRRNHRHNHQRNHQNRGRNHNRHQQPRHRISRDTISLYMDQVLDYINARKEYFNYFRGVFNQRLHKLAQNYQYALERLRQYESRMQPEKKEELEPFVNYFPEDNEFSTNHPDQELPGGADENPLPALYYHELVTQKEAKSYADDTEESSGSLEDYQKYKDQILIN